MGQTGDGNRVEEIGDAQSSQDVEQPRVKIGDDAQFESETSQLSERRHHVRKQFPGNGMLTIKLIEYVRLGIERYITTHS